LPTLRQYFEYKLVIKVKAVVLAIIEARGIMICSRCI